MKKGVEDLATVKVYDRADEFRIEIAGRFAGECVKDIRSCWEQALREAGPRRFIVDISRLSGYDASGRKLLQDMHKHGTQIAAATPLSLVFLNEISTPTRVGTASLLAISNRPAKRETTPLSRARAAGK